MTTAPTNPWSNISWTNTIADCDKGYPIKIGSGRNRRTVPFGSTDYVSYINRNDAKSQHPIELRFDCLPDPFSGDIDSKVYCLNMNPGKPDPDFNGKKDTNGLYENYYKNMLSHKPSKNDLLFDGTSIICDCDKYEVAMKCILPNLRDFKVNNSNYLPRPHIGDVWQRETYKQLNNYLGRAPKIFGIELFPYHSTRGFSFPIDLPSNEYRNFLINQAMNNKKLIIIMRQQEEWYKIKSIGDRLKNYPNKVFLRNKQRVWISPGNFVLEKIQRPSWACQSIEEVLQMF